MSETRPFGSQDDAGDAETRQALPYPQHGNAPPPPPWPVAPPQPLAPSPVPLPTPPFAPPSNPVPYGQPYGQPYPAQSPPPPYGQAPMQHGAPYGYSPPPPASASAFDLTRAIESLRLGDLLAVGGSTLFILAKFLPFAALQSSRAGFPYAFVFDGWAATNGLWNLLQLVLGFAAIDVALGGVTERLIPASVPLSKGGRYLIIGGLLAVTTLFGLFGLNSVRVGLFGLLLCAGAVVAGGLLKMRILPGDDRFLVANLNTRKQASGNYPPQYGSAPPPGGYPPQPFPPPYGAPPPANPYDQPPPYNSPSPGR